MRNIYFISLAILIISCSKPKQYNNNLETSYLPKYAKGFVISQQNGAKLLGLIQNKDTMFYELLPKNSVAKTSFEKIITPITSIVPTSSSFIAFLEALQVDQSIVGFPNFNYISSDKTYQRALLGELTELGENNQLNIESLIKTQPDLLMTFSIQGGIQGEQIIKDSGIQVIYNGDWLEQHPLGRAEWIIVYGALYDKMNFAQGFFKQRQSDYNASKKDIIDPKKTMISGSIFQGVWYSPGANSYTAKLYKDAGLSYVFRDDPGNGSLSLDPEYVLYHGKNAEFWFAPDSSKSLDHLKQQNKLYKQFKAVKEGNVFSYALKTGKSGAFQFFDQAALYPDRVLQDLIYWSSNPSKSDYEPHYFKRLE
ncbi:MAG: ABC transporter substrate-binding protein [Flavobacteriaceae bacterium]